MLKQIVTISLAAVSSLALAQGNLPQRKSGLWEMTTQAETTRAGKGGPMTMQMCIDQKSDTQWVQMGSGMQKDTCSKQDYKIEKSQITVDSICKVGQSTATTKTVITGNYDSAYRVESQSTYEPPMAGRKEGKVVMDVKWLGPCKAGQRPGDMIMPNGMTMNMNDMMKMQQQMKK